MLGALFAVLSAATFGISNVATRRGVVGSSASVGLYITVILGVPLFVVASVATGQLLHMSDLPVRAWMLLTSVGVLHFLVGRYSNFRAIDAIGANRTQPIQMTNVVYSIIVAIVLLGERLTFLMGVGIALIMIGPIIMVERSKNPKQVSIAASGEESTVEKEAVTSHNASTSPRFAEGYFFGFMSSAAYGTSPIMIRSALDDTGLGIAGGLIAYGAAAVVLVASLAIPGKLREVRGMDIKVLPYFLVSTVSVFLAQMFRFAALAIAPVTVVTPLTRLGVIFTPTFGFFVNRHLENFSPRVLIGIGISALGAIVLALGID
ncbi:MAG: EamA family transporter [Chloroflexota bacterium]|nr:EamA family transporter [Chloroflexota bacterium]